MRATQALAKREYRPIGIAMAAVWVALAVWTISGCARLPYTTKIIREDPRVVVLLQHEVAAEHYTHPVELSPDEVTSILRGFSIRKQQRLPLRWFEEEVPPKELFREDDLSVLARPLAEGLRRAGPQERVHFELRAPGNNPTVEWLSTVGWLAVQDDRLRLEVQLFQVMTPKHRSDPYDLYYPTAPPVAQDYLLYFEPGRYWGKTGGSKKPVLRYREFLKGAPIEPVP